MKKESYVELVNELFNEAIDRLENTETPATEAFIAVNGFPKEAPISIGFKFFEIGLILAAEADKQGH